MGLLGDWIGKDTTNVLDDFGRGLLMTNDFGKGAAYGFQAMDDRRKKGLLSGALQSNDPKTLGLLMQEDPELGMKVQQQRQQQADAARQRFIGPLYQAARNYKTNPQAFDAIRAQAAQGGFADAANLTPDMAQSMAYEGRSPFDIAKMEQEQQMSPLQLQLLRSQIAENNAQAARAMRPESGMMGGMSNTAFDNASNLRKEFIGQAKPFMETRDSFGRVVASAKNPTPAGDLALLYNYMKMIDPGAVVRESDFSLASNAAPLLTRMGLDPEKFGAVWRGERLTPDVRNDIVGRAQSLLQEQQRGYSQLHSRYQDLSKKFGYDPSLIVTDPYVPQVEQAAPQGGGGQPERVQAEQISQMVRSGQAQVLQDQNGKQYLRMKDGREFDLEAVQ